jgi:hypothetical protein
MCIFLIKKIIQYMKMKDKNWNENEIILMRE